MADDKSQIEYSRAMEDFKQARTKAEIQQLWAGLTGKSLDLLRFDELTQKMHAKGYSSKGIKEIPLDAIVGSVNRYQDFNRDFLPLHDVDMERWARVKAMMTSPGSPGLPPIRVYKLGKAYFVLDGNHRVSIARQMGLETIEAYVTEIRSKVVLSPEDSPEDIILKEEYADFLEQTNVDEIIPQANLKLTFPGQYETLEEHIRVHRYYMGLEESREISWEEAVQHWFEHVYLPVINVIREQDILNEFPERTETDLYLWVLDHQTFLEKEYGWSIRTELAASDLVGEKESRLRRIAGKFDKANLDAFLTHEWEDYSMSQEPKHGLKFKDEVLFSDILVPLSGTAESWVALDQALVIAKLENAEVRGLVIIEDDRVTDDELISEIYQNKLDKAGVSGNISYADGSIPEVICERARVNDLIILKLSYPPSANILSRLSSGMRTILQKCPRPILLVRNEVSMLKRLLLAFDGSPKGRIAMFVAAYLASRYELPLTVLVVEEDEDRGQKILLEAKKYLGDCCVNSVFKTQSGNVSQTILEVAEDEKTDLILMGGYGLSSILEALFGSTVDDVLRETHIPVLICQ